MATEVLDSMILAWLDWHTECYPPEPVLITHRASITTRSHLMRGCRLSLSLDVDARFCIGHLDQYDNVHPCEADSVITRGLQCAHCLERDLFWKCARCRGRYCINPNAKDFCLSNKHVVYLAAYSPEIVKVGTAWSPRFKKRIAEQGASMAIRIAVLDSGLLARKLERKIEERLKIRDRVTLKGKRAALRTDHSSSAIENLILTTQQLVLEEFADSTFARYFVQEEEVYDLYSPYRCEVTKYRGNGLDIMNGRRRKQLRWIKGRFVVQRGWYTVLEIAEGQLIPGLAAVHLRNHLGARILEGYIECE